MTIREALVHLGKSRCHILLIVSDSGCLLGTLADGDVRRALLHSVSLDAPVDKIMFRAPKTVSPGTDRAGCLALMQQHEILQLPVADSEGRVTGLVLMEDFVRTEATERPNWVVLMAGGRGQRLRPLTETTPKPMLPIGGRPLLETIVEEMARCGFKRFYISINYQAETVIEHFGDGSRFGVEIRYLRENEELGTAGALGLIEERPTAPLLVMNGDILTKIDFSEFLKYHTLQGATATVATRTFEVRIPFGVIANDGHVIQGIVEKPVRQYQVNAGIYVFEPDILSRILGGSRIDMPDLLSGLIAAGKNVVGFPIHEYWTDIGRLEDFTRAVDEYSDFFS